MDNAGGQTSQALQAGGLIQIARERRDALGTQSGRAVGRRGES